MIQELIWKIQPDIIIETGTKHGGSAVFYASICKLIDKGKVISIDINPQYDESAIKKEFGNRIQFIVGNSTDQNLVDRISMLIKPHYSVLVVLDSDHSKTHVLEELECYSKFVTPGSYIVVFDGSMEYIHPTPKSVNHDWKNDNPAVAARQFQATHPDFIQDHYYTRLGITYCLDGYLHRRGDQSSKRIDNPIWQNIRQKYWDLVPLRWRLKARDIRKMIIK